MGALTACLIALSPAVVLAETVNPPPDKDNTLYESSTGDRSNGSGAHLFAGRTLASRGGLVRRALISFDLGDIPSHATVNSVQLTLNVSRTPPGQDSQSTSLHKVLSDWGEGASDASGAEGSGTTPATGDATWIHTSFDTELWNSAGGDFAAAASASLSVGENDKYTWESSGMVADVQAWIDSPSTNFGWLLKGNEADDQTARRFDSRENANSSDRPTLTVDYTVTEIEGDVDGDGRVDITDVLIIIDIILEVRTPTAEERDAANVDASNEAIDSADLAAVLDIIFGQ